MGLFDFNDVSVVGPALNAMAQVTAAGVSAHENKKAMKRQFEMNKYMAEWQNQVNKENWRMQNAYNSPSAQMERLRQAGLNPNLVTGTSNQSGNAGSIPAFDAPRYEAFHEWDKVSDKLPDILNSIMQVAQVQKTVQETKNLRTYQRNLNTENEFNELRMIGQRAINSKTQQEEKIWSDYWDKKLYNLLIESKLSEARTSYTNSQQDYLNGAQTEYTKANTELSLANQAKTIADIGLNQYRKQLLQAQAQSFLASAGLSNAQANRIATLLPVEYQKGLSEISLTDSKKAYQDIENQVYDAFMKSGVDLKEGRIDKSLIKSLAWMIWQSTKNIKL